MKKIVVGLLLLGALSVAFATDARIQTMGGTDHFFRDEQSIFRNSANIGMYDRMLYGSYGVYTYTDETYRMENHEPKLPFFMGTMSFPKEENSTSKFIVGVGFNRYDSLLYKVLFNDSLGFSEGDSITYSGIDDLVGKIDIMVGQTLNNGLTLAAGAYVAFQNDSPTDVEGKFTRLVRGNIGISGPLSDGVDFEASVALSAVSLTGYNNNATSVDSSSYYTAMDNDIGFQIDVRAFADMPKGNGEFVPHIQATVQNYGSEQMIDFNGGFGVNINIDRGFFWTGIEGMYSKKSRTDITTDRDSEKVYGTRDMIGGKVAMGIERNVLTDWFVIRVGASKLLAKESLDSGNKGSHWVENPEADHVSLGMGVNIEDRLKIDFVLAENIPYTFANLFSGNSSYLSTRVSATFNF